MKVFKFGGASIKSAKDVENIAWLLKNYAPEQVVVIVSAMGKTTNALEQVLESWYANDGRCFERLHVSKNFHLEIVRQLFSEPAVVIEKINNYFLALEKYISEPPLGYSDFDYNYDQIVSTGELVSTTIIAEYLKEKKFDCRWFDVRKLLITDRTWREGNVDWAATERMIQKNIFPVFAESGKQKIALTQGFLGGTADGKTTTIGREGSDYTAAIFSYALNADEMVVWKDVPGILNADPKIMDDTVLLPIISYGEAIELTYYGATIIHPKTIKPLQNKQIPLHVRSFIQPESPGTLITQTAEKENLTPSYIVKNNQLLISISPKNFSFIAEQNLSEIFAAFAKTGIRINMSQNSAISFTACVANDERKIRLLFDELQANFSIKYNSGLQLVTIRHWTPKAIDKMVAGKTILLEQRNRTMVQIVTVL